MTPAPISKDRSAQAGNLAETIFVLGWLHSRQEQSQGEREKEIHIYLHRATIERQVEVQHCMTVSVGQDHGVFAIFVCVFVFFVPRFFFTSSLVEVSFGYFLTRRLIIRKCKSAAEGQWTAWHHPLTSSIFKLFDNSLPSLNQLNGSSSKGTGFAIECSGKPFWSLWKTQSLFTCTASLHCHVPFWAARLQTVFGGCWRCWVFQIENPARISWNGHRVRSLSPILWWRWLPSLRSLMSWSSHRMMQDPATAESWPKKIKCTSLLGVWLKNMFIPRFIIVDFGDYTWTGPGFHIHFFVVSPFQRPHCAMMHVCSRHPAGTFHYKRSKRKHH